MNVAADAASSGPPWVVVAGLAVTLVVGLVAARAPIWLEKAKVKFGKPKESHTTPAEKAATGEAILREWLDDAFEQRDAALKEVKRRDRRIEVLTAELYRRGWDGRTA